MGSPLPARGIVGHLVWGGPMGGVGVLRGGTVSLSPSVRARRPRGTRSHQGRPPGAADTLADPLDRSRSLPQGVGGPDPGQLSRSTSGMGRRGTAGGGPTGSCHARTKRGPSVIELTPRWAFSLRDTEIGGREPPERRQRSEERSRIEPESFSAARFTSERQIDVGPSLKRLSRCSCGSSFGPMSSDHTNCEERARAGFVPDWQGPSRGESPPAGPPRPPRPRRLDRD